MFAWHNHRLSQGPSIENRCDTDIGDRSAGLCGLIQLTGRNVPTQVGPEPWPSRPPSDKLIHSPPPPPPPPPFPPPSLDYKAAARRLMPPVVATSFPGSPRAWERGCTRCISWKPGSTRGVFLTLVMFMDYFQIHQRCGGKHKSRPAWTLVCLLKVNSRINAGPQILMRVIKPVS